MRIISNYSKCYADGIEINLGLDSLSSDSDIGLFHGYYWVYHPKEVEEQKKKYKLKRTGLLDLWSPTSIFSRDNFLKEHESFDKVFCICPYTCEWMNNRLGYKKYIYSLYPFTNINVLSQQKPYDICYFGSLVSIYHRECINIITKFNYQFSSQIRYPEITAYCMPHIDKLKMVATCKAGLSINFLSVNNTHINNIQKYDNWKNNKACSNIPCQIPQFKARIHELAACHTLILCMKDQWNLIEDYYTEGEHFIYFNKPSEFEALIIDIKNNWEKYQPIAEAAHQHFLKNHTILVRYKSIKEELTK